MDTARVPALTKNLALHSRGNVLGLQDCEQMRVLILVGRHDITLQKSAQPKIPYNNTFLG
jgi:hypothetical protein